MAKKVALSSEEDTIMRAAQALQDAGFEIPQLSPYTIHVAAPISTSERAFGDKISPHEISTRKSGGVTEDATFFCGEDTAHFGLLSAQGTSFENLIEGVAIGEGNKTRPVQHTLPEALPASPFTARPIHHLSALKPAST